MQVWAAIDVMKGRVVSLLKGDPANAMVWGVDPATAAQRWEREGADGLHVVDLDRALGSGSNELTIRSLLKAVEIPVQVGGGIRSAEDALKWIEYGTSRIVVGTMAYAGPDGLAKIVEKLGPRKVVAAIDFKGRFVVTDGWRRRQETNVFEASEVVRRTGVNTVVVTAVERDGTASGPDLGTYERLCTETRMSVLASGGIRSAEDLTRLRAVGVDGAILGRALYENSIRIAEARSC
jgi:phosphoribosylformimino-5-aminoimidazole carboxamide ribotide isomerase